MLSSGCFGDSKDVFREYNEVFIQSIDVMSTPQGENTLLTVTPYIRNDQDTESPMLYVKIKIIGEETNLIVAEKDVDMGYVKAESFAYNTASLGNVKPGNYKVEAHLFHEGQLLSSGSKFVTIKAGLAADQPADILLTDMNLVIAQFTDRDSKAVVDVFPGIYNQGGDSRALTMVVTAKTDEYTSYNESDELGIIKGSNQLRGHVRFVFPRRAEYTFLVTVEENGKEIITSETIEPIKMDKIERNIVKNYPLVEEGTPVEVPEEGTPGFGAPLMLATFLLTAGIMICRNPESKNDGREKLHGWNRK